MPVRSAPSATARYAAVPDAMIATRSPGSRPRAASARSRGPLVALGSFGGDDDRPPGVHGVHHACSRITAAPGSVPPC